MQRQLYPALLLITIALGAALYLRPTVGEELMALAGVRGGGTTASHAQVGSGGSLGCASQATVFPQGFTSSSQRAPTAQSSQWPRSNTGAGFTGEVRPAASPSYDQAGPQERWPTSSFEYSGQSQAAPRAESPAWQCEGGRWPNPQSRGEAARSSVGPPPYPVAGSAANDPQLGATPSSYPLAGGATRAPGDSGAPDRYPTAGPASVISCPEQTAGPTHPGTSYGGQPPHVAPGPAYPGHSGQPSYPSYVGSSDYRPTTGTAAQPDFGPAATEGEPSPCAAQPGYPPSVAGQDYRANVAPPDYGRCAVQPEYGPNAGRSVARPGYGPPAGRPNQGPSVTSALPRPAQTGAPAPAQPDRKPCEGAQVLAWVGDDVILASEVIPAREEIMSRIPKSRLDALPKQRLELEKKALTAKILEERIQTKLLCYEAKRTIPEEGLPDIKRKIGKYFEEEELPKRIEKAGVASRQELDEKLRAIGGSIDRAKRAFIEQSLAAEWLRQQKGPDPKISHEQMLDYYWEHLANFETPARARWEKLSVRKPRYGGAREARARLAQMGNQIIQGRSMAEVLKNQSQGDLKCEGGVQGWITQGNLEVSQGMEEVIFGLPVGKPSRIFEEGDCLHIVRVLEREEFKRQPFEDPEVQKQIREKLQDVRRREQVQEYLAKLREEIPVRTVFDDDPELAELRRKRAASRE